MAATVVPGANATLEVLNLYNYEDWSLRVKTYLIAEGLWGVLDAKHPYNNGATENMIWSMTNAKALHAIQISCRTDVFGFIGDIWKAKDAWEILAKRLKPKNRDIKGIAATPVPSEVIDLKALNKENYKKWSFWVRTYLVAENLWEVVEGRREAPEEENGEAEFMTWRKNNARALHVITVFCGEDAESCVRDSEIAEDAWNTLAEKYKTTAEESSEGTEESSEGYSDDDPNSNDGIAEEEIGGHQEFFQMVRDQRWEAVREYIERHPAAVRWKDPPELGTPLHYAVVMEEVDGVKVLLPLMKKRDLDILDYSGSTALCLAIENSETDDAIEIVKCIVEKNKKLLLRAVSPAFTNDIPLLYALSLDKPKMADCLYSDEMLEMLKSTDKAEIISSDILLKLLWRFPDSIFAKNHSGECPLIELAGTRAGLFPNVSQLRIWKQLIYRCIHIPRTPLQTRYVSVNIPEEDKDQGNQKQPIHKVKCFFGRLFTNLCNLSGIGGIYQMKFLHVRTLEILEEIGKVLQRNRLNHKQRKIVEKALFQAVERGHAPFIILAYRRRGESWFLLDGDNRINSWFFDYTNEHDKTLFQFAAEQRQDKIFDLISRPWFDPKDRKEIIGRKDKFGNNMLHVVGKLSPLTKIDHIRGPALQMQYELQWFKKVEHMADPKDLDCINSDGRTPREEFTWNHRALVEAGEKSMKETATSSSALVAALIITIMFAAAVTVPGGIGGDTGIPIYLHTKAFRIFIVADVISLCSSTTSVMVFVGILTSRFAEQDFLTSLPTKLIIGFLTLFLSIGAMMTAFSSAIFIMLPGKPSIAISSFVLASFPIASFLWMQFPYLREIIISTYGSSFHPIYQRLEGWAQSIYRLISRRIRRLLNSVGTWCQSNPRANRCCI